MNSSVLWEHLVWVYCLGTGNAVGQTVTQKRQGEMQVANCVLCRVNGCLSKGALTRSALLNLGG